MAQTEVESLRASESESAGSRPLVHFWDRFAVPLLILLNLSITLPLAYKLNIWVDEAFSLHTTGRGLGYALNQSLNFELQAPLYFILLTLWRELNDSIFFARLFSVISVVLAIKVAVNLSQRYWKEVHPAWIATALAFNPLLIIIAVDIRLYAFVLLLASLLMLTFYDGYLAPTRSRRAQACYLALAVVGLYTHYYTGFLLAAHGSALLVLKRWRALIDYLIGMLVGGLCFAPMLPFLRYQLSAHTTPMQNSASWVEGIKAVTWRVKDFLLPSGWEPLLVWRSWLFRICYVAAVIVIIKRRRDLRPETIAIWITTIVLMLFFLATARLSGEILLQPRHMVVLFLPAIFFAYSILNLAGKKALLGWTLVALLFSFSSLYARYRPMAKFGDWQRVAGYLMAKEKPGQAILVFHAGAALPLSEYYSGPNRLVPLPRENTFERFDFRDYVLRDERQIIAALEAVPGDHEVLWLVTDSDCVFADLSYNCLILEEFVNKNYTVEEKADFQGSKVRLLRRKHDSLRLAAFRAERFHLSGAWL